MVKRGRDVSEGVCGSSLPLQRTFEFCVILAPWQGPSETAISLSLRLRRFQGRRQTGSGAFEAMRCRVQSGRRIQRISETLDVGWSSGAPIGAEPFVNRSLLP